ncbi:dUTPase [Spraguea lophii 42_110]|uniref:dUTP diphosphatase n=1 Tax=Spraguea lophii (strain 42_110) TaxID=1358809 RepID=S7W9V8_SPRLO|nr:dUTPase [Spraguea lophii 42_110]
MSKEQVCIEKRDNTALLPEKEGSGFCLFACESAQLKAGDVTKISTGLSMSFNSQCFGYVQVIEKLALKGVRPLAGVCDSDYRGLYNIVMFHEGKDIVEINKGDKIATINFLKVADVELIEVEELSETHRGDKGFGSTGV